MASVLIIATEQIIGGLLGQLVELAGHAAHFRSNGDEAGEAVRNGRPAVVMVDAAYGRSSLAAVAEAAAEVQAAVVYFGTTVSPFELRRFALERGAKYFALPAGPRLLRQVLASALGNGAEPAATNGSATGGYAVSAAAAAVARAQALAERAADIRTESRSLRGEHEAALADCRRSYAELRDAVIAYTRELRGAGIPADRTLEMVKAALRSDDAGTRAGAGMGQAMDDVLEWCLQAYYAA
jgi:DNA-binding response OmpR family regulator